MSGNLVTDATVYAYDGLTEDYATFQGKIKLPYHTGGADLFRWWSELLDDTVVLEFYRGVKV